MRVILVEPNTPPRIVEIENTLKTLQNTVGGYIEVISMDHIDSNLILICNEEGKLIGLDGNRRVGRDIIVGVFYVMSEDREGNRISLSEKKIQYYQKLFWEPQTFDREEIEDTLYMYFA